MTECDIIIIGGGSAGVSAAVEAARQGASVALIEETSMLGGKVLRQTRTEWEYTLAGEHEKKIERALFQATDSVKDSIALFLNTLVWDVTEQNTVALYSDGNPSRGIKHIKAKKFIISVGALERTVPFPGWTLPGVFTVGGLNSLVKKGILPGSNFLLAGSGPILLALANNLIRAGGKISAIVQAASLRSIAARSFQLLSGMDAEKVKSGLSFLCNIKKHKIPLHNSHIIARANGKDAVQEAIIVKVDASWKPAPGTEKTVPVDTIAYAYGLIPSVELTRLCGCSHQFDERLGYWRIEHTERMETSIPGIFIAGDGLRIKGYEAAVEEGKVAAREACAQLGYLTRDEANRLCQLSLKKLDKSKRFGMAMDILSAPRAGILHIMSDETIVCRCEEVTVGDVRTAVGNGARDVNDIKRRTRLGMGHCQGRFCGQVINELTWKLTGSPRNREVFTPRIPLKPVPFEAMAGNLE